MDLVLPGTAAGLCVVLAWAMLRRFVARRRLHELIWGVTFCAFGVAAGAEAYASLFGWTPALVRLYYLAGASLSVGLLALGTLVLLVPRRIALVALGVVLVQSAFMVFLVLRSPVDPEAIRTAGWSALGRDGSLRALALTINILGTLIVLLGTFGSAYAQWVSGNGSRAFGVLPDRPGHPHRRGRRQPDALRPPSALRPDGPRPAHHLRRLPPRHRSGRSGRPRFRHVGAPKRRRRA